MTDPQSNSDFRLSHDGFWGRLTELVRNTVLPYQWAALNDQIEGASPSHAIENFRIAAGLSEGEFVGMVFQDSDVGKWIEAAAYALEARPDPDLETLVDETVDLLEKAQEPDGYLNTYFSIKEPGRRWSNLWECHELYCAGHLLEGAIAYHRATGKRRFLDVMCRYVDLIERTFGTKPGQIRGYDGHEEIELALLRLFDVTEDPRHLELARFFVEERGREPAFFNAQWEALGRRSHWSGSTTPAPDLEYFQSHLPVREQTRAAGHAVRAVYLYTAMADLARRTADEELAAACERLWNNLTQRQMYVTGAIGSTQRGEAFTFDYDLPNETAYAETCASIGLIFFAQRMSKLEPRSRYADVIELSLYNTVLASMSQDGHRFFYVNPLDVWPRASASNPDRRHVKVERQAWFGCACCPPNLARLVMSLGQYVCQMDGTTLFVHQYVSGTLPLPGPDDASLEVVTDYPSTGRVRLQLLGATAGVSHLALRIPGWCDSFKLSARGEPLEPAAVDADGYLKLSGPFVPGQEWLLDLEMPVQVVEAHPEVRATAGKVCLQRGPLIHCFEEVDNGSNLNAVELDARSSFETRPAPQLGPGALEIVARGWRNEERDWNDDLYRAARAPARKSVQLIAVPYHLWGNRGAGEMTVWLRRRDDT